MFYHAFFRVVEVQDEIVNRDLWRVLSRFHRNRFVLKSMTSSPRLFSTALMVEHFEPVPDFRERFESYPLWTMLTILLLATLCGAPRGQKDIASQVCAGLEPGPWYPAQSPGQVSRSDTADLLPPAPTRRCPQGGGNHSGHELPATPRPCHHDQFPSRSVRRPPPSATGPGPEQISLPELALSECGDGA